ncbi:hypothetical protein ScPMuIL_009404 [Solemya velum]
MWNQFKGWIVKKKVSGVPEKPPEGVDNTGFENKDQAASSQDTHQPEDVIPQDIQVMRNNVHQSSTLPRGRSTSPEQVDGLDDNSSPETDDLKRTRRLSEGDTTAGFIKNVEYLRPEDFLFLGRSCYSAPDSVIEGSEPRRRLRRAEVGSSRTSLSVSNHDSGEAWKLPLNDFSSKKRGSDPDGKSLTKPLRKYYKAQDKLIDTYEGIELHIDGLHDILLNEKVRKKSNRLAKLSFFCNVILLVAKLTAAILSGSLSIISSLVDSVVDLASSVTIWATAKYAKRRDPYVYPQGRSKLEPVGIVILAVIMAVASVVLIIEALEKIIAYAQDPSSPAPIMDPVTISIACLTIVVKLVLFLLCRGLNHPAIRVLALDHRNDVFANSVAVICGYLGSVGFQNSTGKWEVVFVDPLGAIFISLYIVYNWIMVLKVQIKVLTGYTANPDFLSKITWTCVNHHREIKYVDTVRAFHFGNNFLVEVDIVLPEEMTLKEAHNIGEPLQQKIERFPEVERAFVHIDYEFEHHPGEEHKIV